MIRKLIYKLTFSKIPRTEFLRVVILENSAGGILSEGKIQAKRLGPIGLYGGCGLMG